MLKAPRTACGAARGAEALVTVDALVALVRRLLEHQKYKAAAELLRDVDGSWLVFGLIQDMTAFEAREAAIRSAEARYQSIFENAIEGIYQTTPDGRFSIDGLTADEAIATRRSVRQARIRGQPAQTPASASSIPAKNTGRARSPSSTQAPSVTATDAPISSGSSSTPSLTTRSRAR